MKVGVNDLYNLIVVNKFVYYIFQYWDDRQPHSLRQVHTLIKKKGGGLYITSTICFQEIMIAH